MLSNKTQSLFEKLDDMSRNIREIEAKHEIMFMEISMKIEELLMKISTLNLKNNKENVENAKNAKNAESDEDEE